MPAVMFRFYQLLSELATFSLRNDAHFYISDNIMGTQIE